MLAIVYILPARVVALLHIPPLSTPAFPPPLPPPPATCLHCETTAVRLPLTNVTCNPQATGMPHLKNTGSQHGLHNSTSASSVVPVDDLCHH